MLLKLLQKVDFDPGEHVTHVQAEIFKRPFFQDTHELYLRMA